MKSHCHNQPTPEATPAVAEGALKASGKSRVEVSQLPLNLLPCLSLIELKGDSNS